MELFSRRRWRPNWQINLVILLHELSILFSNFTNTTAYHFDWYEPSSPSNKALHGWAYWTNDHKGLGSNPHPPSSEQLTGSEAWSKLIIYRLKVRIWSPFVFGIILSVLTEGKHVDDAAYDDDDDGIGRYVNRDRKILRLTSGVRWDWKD